MLKDLVRTLEYVEELKNPENQQLIKDFYNFLKFDAETRTTERSQVNNLKYIVNLAKFLGQTLGDKNLEQVDKLDIQNFLDTKIKSTDDDPNQKWITTYNDYLRRLKYFFRWVHNRDKESYYEWITPKFLTKIRTMKTKRKSPYVTSNLWTLEELLSIIKYEPNIRNKAILSLLWDCNARPHELCKLQIQHINFMRDKGYALGEIPPDTKTGGREIVLRTSFTYCRDWKNVHPYKENPLAPFFCDLDTGRPLLPATMGAILRVLRNRIKNSLDNGLIIDPTEKEKLKNFIKEKKWNPYCFRHSSITEDGETLPADAIDKKVGWAQGSRMRPIYMNRSIGKTLKNVLLRRDGISIDEEENKQIRTQIPCPFCRKINSVDIEICECGGVLSQVAYNRIKEKENQKYRDLEKQLFMVSKFNPVIQKIEEYALKQNRNVDISPQVQIDIYKQSRGKLLQQEEIEMLNELLNEGKIEKISAYKRVFSPEESWKMIEDEQKRMSDPEEREQYKNALRKNIEREED